MSALAAGVTIALASLVCYLVMRSELRAQVDGPLRAQGERIEQRGEVIGQRLPGPPKGSGGPAEFSQVLAPDGEVRDRDGGLTIAVAPGDRAAALGDGRPFLSDRHADGVHLRVLTVPIRGLGAVQIGRSLEAVDNVLARLRIVLLALDPASRDVWRGERRIELTRTEYALLEMLLEHPRQVLTRSQIFERVWGYDFGSTSNALGVYVGYLRRKTEAGGEPRLVHTVRGIGYVLREEP